MQYTPITTHAHSVLFYKTAGVLQYANRDSLFADWLAVVIETFFPEVSLEFVPEDHASVFKAPEPLFVPKSAELAKQRTSWILQELAHVSYVERESLCALLRGWVREREEPKAIVLGITIGVLPIGIMGELRRKREPMAVLFDQRFLNTLHSLTSLQVITAGTHAVVERGLHRAGGSTGRLEPELGDWLFGDKALALYAVPNDTLQSVRTTLEQYDVLHAPIFLHACDTFFALAISPSVYVEDLDEAPSFQNVPLTE